MSAIGTGRHASRLKQRNQRRACERPHVCVLPVTRSIRPFNSHSEPDEKTADMQGRHQAIDVPKQRTVYMPEIAPR